MTARTPHRIANTQAQPGAPDADGACDRSATQPSGGAMTATDTQPMIYPATVLPPKRQGA